MGNAATSSAALRNSAVVIGNSSSGIIEAPAAGVPTVNIGVRQKGRPRAASVLDCEGRRDAIEAAMRRALDPSMRKVMADDMPPYGRPRDTADIMLKHLRTADLDRILRKTFYDLQSGPAAQAVAGSLTSPPNAAVSGGRR